MRRWLALILAVLLVLLASTPVLASHEEMLRSVGDEFSVSTGLLALGAGITFLVLGTLIFFGFRYLYRSKGGEE